jgi:hypothetical protein
MQPFIVFFTVKKIVRINDRGKKLLGLIYGMTEILASSHTPSLSLTLPENYYLCPPLPGTPAWTVY